MVDIATLGLEIDSSDTRRARHDLDAFTRAGGRAETAADGVARGAKVSQLAFVGMRGAVITAAAALGGLAGSAAVLSNFGASMSQVEAITRASGRELSSLRDIAKELGSTTEFSASQAAEGLRFLGMAGFSATQSISAIPAVLDLATASGMGLASAADTASNIMSAFGIAATNASAVSDVLAAASSRANTDVTQLGSAMAYAGPVASALEISLGDTAAAVGVLSDAGIQGSAAGTGLRRVLSVLANTTPAATGALRQMGITLEQVNPATNDLTDIVDLLADKGLTAAQAMEIFGDRGGPAILALVSQNARLSELSTELGSVTGEATRMADTMRDNLSGDLKGAMSAAEGLILALGEAGLTQALRSTVQGITSATRSVTAFVEALGLAASNAGSWSAALSEDQQTLRGALDAATIAAGDQIIDMQKLSAVNGAGSIISLGLAKSHLSVAKARREDIIATREQLRLARLQGDAMQSLNAQADAVRTRMYSIAVPGADMDGVPALRRPAYIEDEELLAAILLEQLKLRDEINAEAGASNVEVSNLTSEIQKLETAIAVSKNGLVDLNGEIITASGVTSTQAIAVSVLSSEYQSAALSVENQLNLMALEASLVGKTAQEQQALKIAYEASRIERELLTAAIADGSEVSDAERTQIDILIGRYHLLAKQMVQVGDKAQETKEAFNDLERNGLISFEREFARFLDGGAKDFDNFADGMVASFSSALNKMIAKAATAKLGEAIGAGKGASGGLLAKASAGFSSLGGSVVAAAPYLIIPTIIGGILDSLFGKTKIMGQGVEVSVAGLDEQASGFTDKKRSGLFGWTNKKWTSYWELPEDVNATVISAVDAAQAGVVNMSSIIGLAADSFDDFSTTLRIGAGSNSITQDLEALTEQMSAHSLAAIGWTHELGTARETLEKLSGEFATVNTQMRLLGLSLYETGAEGIHASQAFISIFDTIEAMTEATSYYFENFYTDQEKLTALSNEFGSLMSSLDIGTIPQTTAQFRELVDELDSMGDTAGVAALIQAAPAFSEILDLSQSFVSDQISQIEQSATASQSAVTTLNNALAARLADGAPTQSVAEAMRFIQSGNTGEGLSQALNTLSSVGTAGYASQVDFLRDQMRATIAIADLRDKAEEQLTEEQQMVELLRGQLEADESAFNEQTGLFKDQLSAEQMQVDLMERLNTRMTEINFSQASAADSGAETVKAIEALGKGFELIHHEIARMAQYTQRTASITEQWNVEGQPAERSS